MPGRTKLAGLAFTTVEPDDVLFIQNIVNRANSGVSEAEFVNDASIANFDGLVDTVRLDIDPQASGYQQSLTELFTRFEMIPIPPVA